MHTLQDHNSELGKLNTRYHVEQRLTRLLSTRAPRWSAGCSGRANWCSARPASMLVVIVLVVYFLAAMPHIKLFFYRLAPQSRRARVILIGDEIFVKVGGYMLGNFLTSLIAGLGTWAWLEIFGVPYPVLLGLLVALLDLIPMIGSTIGGAIVTLVALTVSLPVAVATLAFYIGYRLAEDYLIVPRIMGRTVQVPAVVTVVARRTRTARSGRAPHERVHAPKHRSCRPRSTSACRRPSARPCPARSRRPPLHEQLRRHS